MNPGTPSTPRKKTRPRTDRSTGPGAWAPWLILALVAIAFAAYGLQTRHQLQAQRAALKADRQKLEELAQAQAGLRAQLDAKERDFQVLKALYAQSTHASPALHVIGVYEGRTPAGADDRPWWAKCAPPAASQPSAQAVREANAECHRKHAGEQVEKEVAVDLSDNTRPVVLALSSYSRALWKVKVGPGVEIRRVILSGYGSQRINGLPEGTTIETYTYEASPCPRCVQGGRHFHSWESPALQLREITGLEVTSFQGKYKGESFSIFPGVHSVSRDLAERH